MEHWLYILHSEKLDKYYVGESEDPERRLQEHISHLYKGSSTSISNDWRIVCKIACENRGHARKLERWIKQQKNRRVIQLLMNDPTYRDTCLQRLK